MSVIDLTSKPPKITQSLTSGLGATTVRVSPDGKLALIANRTEGTVSVFSVADKQLTRGRQGRSRQQGLAAERHRVHP